MTDRTYFNIGLSRDMIAQAYRNNESHDSYCFIIAPPSNNLPSGFVIYGAVIEDGKLMVEYENKTPYRVEFYIDNGELFVKFTQGGIIMSLVDLGNVIGPQGPTGATGPQGPTGATGAQGPSGADGISPTFVLGDGTGGTTAGHLYADYDNPYVPS